MTRLLSLWSPVALYMAGLFFLSSQPELPGASLTPDWAQHAVAYAGLALVTLRATTDGRWAAVGAKAIGAAWLIAVLYGLSDEFHQAFVPTRSPSGWDLVADAAGAALALAAAWACGMIRRSP